MRLFFVDDSGSRTGDPRQPYFCFGAFSIDSAHLQQLGHRLAALKRLWRLNAMPDDEIRFNHIGREHDTRRKPNPLVRLGYDLGQRVDFGHAVLAHLVATPSVKLFGVGVDCRQLRDGESAPRWAFQLIAERFEFSLNHETPRVGLIICDQDDVEDEAMRRAMYAGTAWTKLPNFPETIMFVPSHHSPGVQFADFVAGAFGRWWNFRDDKYLAPIVGCLHRDRQGQWRGSGMKSFRAPDYPALPSN